MPLYEFECSQCRKRFEALVRLGREAEVVCSACGSPKIRKVCSSFGIGGGGSRLKAASSCSTCQGGTCSTCR
ncbi:MAG: zinc ribbon domain-containing protein [Candidatus Aminicenantes bacterium]|nr:zinc ribbon domain-containing protein [Candidatus Aminicenantes bacterium]